MFSERLGPFELPGPVDLLFDSVKLELELFLAFADLDALAADCDWDPRILLFKLQSKRNEIDECSLTVCLC